MQNQCPRRNIVQCQLLRGAKRPDTGQCILESMLYRGEIVCQLQSIVARELEYHGHHVVGLHRKL